MFPPMKVFGNAGGPDHDVPAPNLHPATFDEWFAGLNNRPPSQRPGQWAVNTLTPELWTAVNGTPFDAFHINERLPDLIRYARHWWGVMEVSKDGASIPACVFVAVKRGKVPGDTDGCAAGLETPGNASVCYLLRLPEVRSALRLVPSDLYDHDCDPTKESP